jgi:hypothetical protein
MTNSISNVFVQTFADNVRFLAQQSDARLIQWCQIERRESVSHNFERLGAMALGSKAGRNNNSPINDAPWTRRQTVVATYDGGDLVEPDDIVQMLVEPTSKITYALGMAAKRQIDDIIIAKTTAASRDGTGSAVAFVTTGGANSLGQVVGDWTTEISFDFVTQVFESFVFNNIDVDEPKCFVIGPKQLRKLQQLVEYTSSDYANVKTLAEKGYVPNWLGFTWILSNRLLQSNGVGTRDCFAMTRKAMGLHISKDIWAQVAQRPDKSFAWQIYTALTMGSIRVEDEHLVWAKVKDTVT